jgi:ribosome-associated protein
LDVIHLFQTYPSIINPVYAYYWRWNQEFSIVRTIKEFRYFAKTLIMSVLSDLYDLPELERELEYGTSRSSGKGGQHVNTTETRVEIHFNVAASQLLTDAQKDILLLKLGHRLSSEGNLRMYSQKTRSQSTNKEDVVTRFYELIAKSLRPVKKRIRTKPGKAQREARLGNKKATALRKELRKPPDTRL